MIAMSIISSVWFILKMIGGGATVNFVSVALSTIMLSFGIFLTTGALKRRSQLSQLSDSIEDQAEKSIRLISYNQSLYKPFKYYLMLPIIVVTVVAAVLNQVNIWTPILSVAAYLIFVYGAPLENKWIHSVNKKKLATAKTLLAAKPE